MRRENLVRPIPNTLVPDFRITSASRFFYKIETDHPIVKTFLFSKHISSPKLNDLFEDIMQDLDTGTPAMLKVDRPNMKGADIYIKAVVNPLLHNLFRACRNINMLQDCVYITGRFVYRSHTMLIANNRVISVGYKTDPKETKEQADLRIRRAAVLQGGK